MNGPSTTQRQLLGSGHSLAFEDDPQGFDSLFPLQSRQQASVKVKAG